MSSIYMHTLDQSQASISCRERNTLASLVKLRHYPAQFNPLKPSSIDAKQGSEPSISLHSVYRSEEHTSELQSRGHLVCRLLLEKKKTKKDYQRPHKQSCSNCHTSMMHY